MSIFLEPWSARDGHDGGAHIVNAMGSPVARYREVALYESCSIIEDVDPQTARRIVACVNALKSFSTEAVEAGIVEELLAACRAALEYIPGSQVKSWPPGFGLKIEALKALKTVLAKATKGGG